MSTHAGRRRTRGSTRSRTRSSTRSSSSDASARRRSSWPTSSPRGSPCSTGRAASGSRRCCARAVARSLRELPEEPLVVVFSSWSDDPDGCALRGGGRGFRAARRTAPSSTRSRRAQSTRDVYLVLDQAEEYFLYHADDGGPGSSPKRCRRCLPRRLRVNVLVSLREDSLAKLDRFTGRIPGLFANTLRLDRLDRAGGEGRRRAAGRALRGAHWRGGRRSSRLSSSACSTRWERDRSSRRSAGSGAVEGAATLARGSRRRTSSSSCSASGRRSVRRGSTDAPRRDARAARRRPAHRRGASRGRDGRAHARAEGHRSDGSSTISSRRRGRRSPTRSSDLADFGHVSECRADARADGTCPSVASCVGRRGRRGAVRDLPRRPRRAGARVAGDVTKPSASFGAEGGLRSPSSTAARRHRRGLRSCSRSWAPSRSTRSRSEPRRASRRAKPRRTSSSRMPMPSSIATRS